MNFPAPLRQSLLLPGLAAAYFLSAKLGLTLAFVNESATAVWPPTGIALAAFLMLGRQVWPAIFAGAFLVNWTTAGSVPVCLGIALGNTMEGFCGAWLMQNFAGGTRAFDQVRGIFIFIFAAAVPATVISASVGVTTLWAGGLVAPAQFASVWNTWWLGDMAGAVILTPALVLWARDPRPRWTPSQRVEIGGIGLCFFIAWFMLDESPALARYPLRLVSLPLLLWTAVRFGQRETAAAIVVGTALAVLATVNHSGPFQLDTEYASIFLVQTHMGLVAVFMLSMAAAMAQSRNTQERLKEINRGLDTTIRLATEELREQNTLYASLLEAQNDIGDGVAIVEGDRITYANEALCKIYGYSREELLALPSFFALVAPEEREKLLERRKEREGGRGPQGGLTTVVVRKDGSRLPIEYATKVVQAEERTRQYAIIRDISQRRKNEVEVETSEQRFRQLAEVAQEGVVITEQGRIVEVNEAFCRLLGMDYHEVLGKGISDLADPAYRDLVNRRNSGDYSDTYEAKFLARDGSERWVEVAGRPITFRGRPARVKSVRDINQRHQIEEQARKVESLEKFAENLTRSNQELLDFTSVVSHDLQEPLRKVLTFSNLLEARDGQALTPEGKDYLGRMQSAAGRMQRLIQDLLTFSRVTTQAQPMVPVDLGEVAAEVLTDLEVSIRASGGRVEVSPLCKVEADPVQMRQLLQNLISNGLKYHREGVPPQVEVRAEDGPTGTCRILVTDHGIGFDVKYLDRIFKAFQRLHGREKFEGTGMGLAICKRIAERHGGDITALSRVGEGSTFIVTLPLRKAPAAA